MQAAAPSMRPAEAPAVTMPASAPVHSAMISQARPCASPMSIESPAAAAMAAAICGSMRLPLSRVMLPDPLMMGEILRDSNGSCIRRSQ